jgi:hypothetical protein
VSDLAEWKVELESSWRQIPDFYRNNYTVKRTLQCHLYEYLRKLQYRVVADYLPPRIHDRPIDLIAFAEPKKLVYAICIDTVVTLATVKSLMSFESEYRIIFTSGQIEKKVQESRFFLNPEIQHLHLQPFDR